MHIGPLVLPLIQLDDTVSILRLCFYRRCKFINSSLEVGFCSSLLLLAICNIGPQVGSC
jgi:hypothetical protein